MSKNLVDIYSEYGLKDLLVETKKRIEEKQIEYLQVEEKYNPLCADEWRKEISKDIIQYFNDVIEIEEALKICKQKDRKL